MGIAIGSNALTDFHPGVTAREPVRTNRITSLDITRGMVMILMAIDHVRVYAGVPAGGPPAPVFFTRWVTHFAAPAFALLAGTGAYLLGRRLATPGALARHLVLRGLLLIALELTVLRLAWTFNTDFAHYNLAGVLWMLGWCMILMAGLVWLPATVVGAIGVCIIVGQGVFGPIASALPNPLGSFLYLGGFTQIGSMPIGVLYVIVPWIGVMAAGYGFGRVMELPSDERRRVCLRLGLALTAAFLVLATIDVARQSATEDAPPALFRLLNQRKYPASPLFLLMTLGPTLMFIAAAERMRGRVADVIATFGRVPLFFYLLHIPLIHALAVVVSVIREGAVNPWLFGNHPFAPPPVPAGYRWSLWLLYLVFAIAVALLYVPCRWFARVRSADKTGLLRFL